MVNAAITFIFSVLTFYTFYRYILEQNGFFKEVSFVHFIWQMFYLIGILKVIYSANQVTNEV